MPSANQLRVFEGKVIAIAHVLICRIQGEQWTYSANGYSYLVYVMPGPDTLKMRETLDTRTQEGTIDVEIAPQATNFGVYADTAGSWSNGVATLTIGTNSIVVGDTAVISGMSPSGYNGTVLVTAVTSTTFSYAIATNPGAWVSAGTELTSTAWPPPQGIIVDDQLTDILGNQMGVREWHNDDLRSIKMFTSVQSITRQAGVVSQ